MRKEINFIKTENLDSKTFDSTQCIVQEVVRDKHSIYVEKQCKILPAIVLTAGFLVMMLQWILGVTLLTLVGALFMCFTSAYILLDIIFNKRLSIWVLLGYILVSFGIATFYIFNGADAGFGAITSALTGFISGEHPLWQGEGNFGTRLLGNILLSAPAFLLILTMILVVDKWNNGAIKIKNIITTTCSVLLVGMSVTFVFIMNLRATPKVFNMSAGQDDYLKNINKNVDASNPNVLVIMMDDLGYGDTSYNARKANITPSFETPSIDWIAESGLDFDNFYASYSVCSPSRFAMMTGRYPYRAYADNVVYPTVNSLAPLATTRVFNPIEMGNNCDGMLGDEITMAEVLKGAGYKTGCFGKWHLGDYGEYLPTNQGFDYFYGSHHVNDMVPFYHAEETNGNYEIAVGTKDLNQSDATKIIHQKTEQWITEKAQAKEKFFAYYATPWPHAPIFAGKDFQGTTGAGIYGDCVTEFDHYLGELFKTMENLGVLDDTLIVFTSDNGPALQGSMNELRGGKFSAYDGGQKVPFYMRWGNNPAFSNSAADKKARTVSTPATLIDLYPTIADICQISNTQGKKNYLPSDVDREIDGLNLMPAINDLTNKTFLHDANHPILHMKREQIKAVQFCLTKEQVLKSVEGYVKGETHSNQVANESAYAEMPFIKNNDYTTWKYFKKMKNDNPEFFDKKRKNWLMCLTDDSGESYQRADVFPTIAKQANDVMASWTKKFKENRRGYYTNYYKK
ncbi:MAG: sulfatase-like hydrolase/transferase [Clostridia bacterium]